MALYHIHHKTIYDYVYPVTVSHHTARLTPITNDFQTCEKFDITVTPESTDLIRRIDYFGNEIHFFSVQQLHKSLTVESQGRVRVTAKSIDLQILTMSCGEIRDALNDQQRSDLLDAKQYLYATEMTYGHSAISEFARRFLGNEISIGEALGSMLDIFWDEFKFDPEATEVSTPVSDVLAQKRGVCQDFAHLSLAALRAWGLSACYVSGYILTEPPAGEERLLGADASHAWISVFVPNVGWVELDPTNRKVCGKEHIRVAYGRDYSDVSMLSGAVTGGGEHTIKVEVTVMPMEERI
jgi:transglutaminase-like putative cysteine protease